MKDRGPVEIPAAAAAAFEIRAQPGYYGMFTRRQAAGAYLNGSRVVKTHVDPDGDRHPVGACGVVLGSISSPNMGLLYFVEWDATPRVATAVIARKIAPAP